MSNSVSHLYRIRNGFSSGSKPASHGPGYTTASVPPRSAFVSFKSVCGRSNLITFHWNSNLTPTVDFFASIKPTHPAEIESESQCSSSGTEPAVGSGINCYEHISRQPSFQRECGICAGLSYKIKTTYRPGKATTDRRKVCSILLGPEKSRPAIPYGCRWRWYGRGLRHRCHATAPASRPPPKSFRCRCCARVNKQQ